MVTKMKPNDRPGQLFVSRFSRLVWENADDDQRFGRLEANDIVIYLDEVRLSNGGSQFLVVSRCGVGLVGMTGWTRLDDDDV